MSGVLLVLSFSAIVVGSFIVFRRILERELSLPKSSIVDMPTGVLAILGIAAISVPGISISAAYIVLKAIIWLVI